LRRREWVVSEIQNSLGPLKKRESKKKRREDEEEKRYRRTREIVKIPKVCAMQEDVRC
jgi:hypothetical protein